MHLLVLQSHFVLDAFYMSPSEPLDFAPKKKGSKKGSSLLLTLLTIFRLPLSSRRSRWRLLWRSLHFTPSQGSDRVK